MAGIIFTHKTGRAREQERLRLSRRQLLIGSAALTGGLALGGPVSAQTPMATPVGARASGPLGDLLALIPAAQATKAAGAGVLFFYADLETQLAHLGIPQDGADPSTEMLEALRPLATASQAFSYALAPEFAETFGFNTLNTHRTLYAGAPPDDLTFFKGGFDPETVGAALEASGFERKSAGSGIDFWTVGEEGELDLSSPVSRFGVGAMNNAVILNDDVLVFGRFATAIKAIVRQAAEPGPSLADQPGVAPVIESFSSDMVSAIAVTPSFLSTSGMMTMPPEQQKQFQEQFTKSDDAVGRMPRIDLAMFGVEAGASVALSSSATPVATPGVPVSSPVATPVVTAAGASPLLEVRLHTRSAKDAAQVAKVVAWRWEHFSSMLAAGEPYAELLTLVSADVSPVNEQVAAIDFDQGERAGLWLRLVTGRDLLIFAG
ncbi:MAG TPA: hypothetical protein VNZ55_11950 [Thermomicrobiales bacterium]|nr:hypothetical protein [Thermomicrobiales bacterium]